MVSGESGIFLELKSLDLVVLGEAQYDGTHVFIERGRSFLNLWNYLSFEALAKSFQVSVWFRRDTHPQSEHGLLIELAGIILFWIMA